MRDRGAPWPRARVRAGRPAFCRDRAACVRLVEAEIFADGVDGKSEPPQALDKDEARPILIIEDAGAAHARRRNESALLVETDALRGERKLVGELGDAV